jgi:RimJ/RimL family protein N-acetyltransferase
MKFNLEDVKINPLTEKYYKQNIDLMNEIAHESHFLARSEDLSYGDNLRFIDTYFGHPNTIYLVAVYQEILIGHILSLPRFEDLLNHLVSIGYLVHKKYRKNGAGSKLMESLIFEIRKRGNIKILCAEVASDNIASQNLLKKYNFKEYGRLKDGLMTKNNEFVDLYYFSKYINH